MNQLNVSEEARVLSVCLTQLLPIDSDLPGLIFSQKLNRQRLLSKASTQWQKTACSQARITPPELPLWEIRGQLHRLQSQLQSLIPEVTSLLLGIQECPEQKLLIVYQRMLQEGSQRCQNLSEVITQIKQPGRLAQQLEADFRALVLAMNQRQKQLEINWLELTEF